MLKRTLLAFTFVAALGAAGVGMANKAEAHGGYYRGFGGYHGWHSSHHRPFHGHGFHRHHFHPHHVHRHHFHRGHFHHGHRHHRRGGVSFWIGF